MKYLMMNKVAIDTRSGFRHEKTPPRISIRRLATGFHTISNCSPFKEILFLLPMKQNRCSTQTIKII